MKFNPITNTLYTDNNELIKKMHCPYSSLAWNDFTQIEGSINRFCAICESNVIDTHNMSDESLLELLQKDPQTCLKIDFTQKNIRIIHNV